jgi:hypothetical protein
MRAKAGVPVASKADTTPTAAVSAEPEVEEEIPAAVAATETAADPMAEVPAELLNKPFKELTKEERVIVARARSRAMRAKSGLPVASKTEGAPAVAAKAPAVAEPMAPEEEEEAPAAVAATEAGADPMAEVPAELLNKPFKELTKEERIIVARARSRAVRAKAGKPVGDAEA